MTDESLRSDLGIPDEAIVFGRHGGDANFDIDFVHSAISAVLEHRSNVWFVFLDTYRFLAHPRVVHLPPVTDRADVRRFVNTCDYMLHANSVGETFGLAVAEFALVGAPVLTYLKSPQLAHLELLGSDLLIGYVGYDDLLHHLRTLPRRTEERPSLVSETYSVDRVMRRFHEVFLS